MGSDPDVDVDYVSCCLDEVALEGLDGITLSALWQRLAKRPRFSIQIDEKSKSFLWRTVALHPEIQIFELPEPRPPLVIFNRYDHVDIETGIIVEPAKIPLDIYPIFPIKEGLVRGSCEHFKARKNISRSIRSNTTLKISLDQAIETWGEKLVLVASQQQRYLSLIGSDVDPTMEFTILQYLMLERIGRSRYHGEVTQGRMSLVVLKEAPKNLHYQRKRLLAKNLITKQVHYQRNTTGQTTCGKLLHLTRFYVEKRPKFLLMLQQVCEILSKKENQMAPVHSLRMELGMKEGSFKKMFQRNVHLTTVVMATLKEVSPDLPNEMYYHANGKEKHVKCLKLCDNVDISKIGKEGEEEDDEEVEEETEELPQQDKPPILCIDRPLLNRVWDSLNELGPDGASLGELSRYLGMPQLDVRLLCRNLERHQIVTAIMKDVGRQRVCKYVSRRFENENQLHKQFMEERRKILELTKNEGNNASDPSTSFKTEQKDAESGDELPSNSGSKKVEDTKPDKGSVSFIKEIEEWDKNASVNKTSHLTYRLLRRANFILNAVKEEKLFDDIYKIQKLIMSEEAKEGYNRIDKKSVLRLINKLAKDGYVNSFKTVLRLGTKTKKLHIVCAPEISQTDPIVRSAVDRAKYKYFFSPGAEKFAKSTYEGNNPPVPSVRNSINTLQNLYGGTSRANLEYMPSMGRFYGIEPKFVRMRVLHEFLFYLVYDYKGLQTDENTFEIWDVKESNEDSSAPKEIHVKEDANAIEKANVSGKKETHVPRVYTQNTEQPWKMFIPPLPCHIGWDKGWCLISDILLRIPLSIFVKIVNCTFRIDQLEAYLKHPVKQHYLIAHLPQSIRSALLFARRYIFSVSLIAERLAYIGLLSFGPHQYKEKDQKFVYLHQHASLWDTRSSPASYFKIAKDMNYSRLTYHFRSHDDIDKYWVKLRDICLHTKLGIASSCHGQAIVIEKLYKKQDMVEACKSKSPSEIRDEGDIPGDNLGAAGFDSALFSHLKRNWQYILPPHKTIEEFCSKMHKKRVAQTEMHATEGMIYKKYLDSEVVVEGNRLPQTRLQKWPRKQKLTLPISQKATTSKESKEPEQFETAEKPNVPNAVRMKGQKRKKETDDSLKEPRKKVNKTGAADKTIRVLRKKNFTRIRRPYYDEIDKEALRLQSKLRVVWKPQEDSFLLLIKVASTLIDPNHFRYLIISSPNVRDLLHEFIPGSKNKTSRACQRRIVYMLKNSQTVYNVAVFVGEAKQDDAIMELVPAVVPTITKEALIVEIARKIIVRLMQKFTTKTPQIEDSKVLEQLQSRCHLVSAEDILRKDNWKMDVKNVVDIHFSVVYSLILSSLACSGDKANWSYQLFRIYQQYPDNLLRSVFTRLRNDKLISKKKGIPSRPTRILPLSTMPYQLSISYEFKFLTRYQPEIFEEAHSFVQNLLANYNTAMDSEQDDPGREIIVDQQGGYPAALLTLLALQMISLDVDIPEHVILFDYEGYVGTPDQQQNIVKRWMDFQQQCKITTTKEGSTNFVQEPTVHIDSRESRSDSLLRKVVSVTEDAEMASSSVPDANNEREMQTDKIPQQSDSLAPSDGGTQESTGQATNTVAAKTSRVSLYMLRQQMSQNPAERKQHSQDYIVVNSCKVVARLNPSLECSDPSSTPGSAADSFPSPILDHDYFSNATEMMPKIVDPSTKFFPSNDDCNEIVQSQTCYISNERTSLEAVTDAIPTKLSEDDIADLKAIYHFICNQKEMGATTKSLNTNLKDLKGSLSFLHHLEHLRQTELILRVGVNTIRYVAFPHCKPWILQSVQVPRDDKVRASEIVKIALSSGETKAPEIPNCEPSNKDAANPNSSLELPKSTDPQSSGANNPAHDNPTTMETRAESRKRKHSQSKSAVGEHCIGKNVQFLCRLWRKPDGYLNRPVLRTLLISLMSYIMSAPGLNFHKIVTKFAPTLQPLHIVELLEILEKAKCIIRVHVAVETTTLFSPRPTVELADATNADLFEEEVLIEPELDCILKLGHLLSHL